MFEINIESDIEIIFFVTRLDLPTYIYLADWTL
jgi:hypothetical protein